MPIKDDPEALEGVVVLAKAFFGNLDLMRALERESDLRAPQSRGQRLAREARDRILKAHREGLFLEFRRLLPGLTDEALENRLTLINDTFHRALPQIKAGLGLVVQTTSNSGSRELDGLLSNLPDLLKVLAETFLCEAPDGSLRVRSRLIGLWQDLILVVPPLVVVSAWICARSWREEAHTRDDLRSLVGRMAHWLTDSTLPIDDDPSLDHLCRQHGLDEMHMHLNGSTEAEKVWSDALTHPKRVVDELARARDRSKESGLRLRIGSGVDRLFRQEDSQLTPDLLLNRLEDAAVLKGMMLRQARGLQREKNTEVRPADFWAEEGRRALPDRGLHMPMVVREAWYLCTILARPTEPLHLVHYLLLRAQFCRLVVQQSDQVGFDQFQYITLNDLRTLSEAEFAERFRQFERGQTKVIDTLEGRFAPKADLDGLAGLLGSILRGYLRFLSEDEIGRPLSGRKAPGYGSLPELLALVRRTEVQLQHGAMSPTIDHRSEDRKALPVRGRRLRLGLVAHFIKARTLDEHESLVAHDGARLGCRDARTREKTATQARVLVALLQRVPELRNIIRAADAAANERHAGPEVFAPAFRILRRDGMKRFTYHVGEDFAHLASGLRAMVEAVTFLDLDAGCRLGHGTAAGLVPEAWWKAQRSCAVLPMDHRLDDLVFARDMLKKQKILQDRLPAIEAEIHRLAMEIWEDPGVTCDLLSRSWRMRSLDPLARELHLDDVDPHRKAEARLHDMARKEDPKAYRHFMLRHGICREEEGISPRQIRNALRRGDRQIRVDEASEVLDTEVLSALQRGVLRMLSQRRMAIETLPSSNVRISIHDDYEDHHVMTWLRVRPGTLNAPVDVVTGSDDPGIFATTLRMEYAHILRCLRKEIGNMHDQFDPVQVVEKMCLDAKRFRF